MNKMNKIILALPFILATQSVLADQFYLDPGTNYDVVFAPNEDKVCDTCTSLKDEFNFIYQSTSTITDMTGDGISAGDLISTNGGLSVGPLGNNQILGFNPNESFGSDSNNGYGDWALSFSITDLPGIVTSIVDDVPIIAYGPGLLEMFVTFDGSTFNNFMDIALTGGATAAASSYLFGGADFNNVDAGYNNLFNSKNPVCNNTGLWEIWKNCEAPTNSVQFAFDFNTNLLTTNFAEAGVDQNGKQLFSVTSDHDGSGVLSVPEPTSIAILGLGLLGLAGARRRS